MDTFGTAALRDRVLAAWSASPARFREDANAEEELVRGAYRDRLVVELAQNAADAASRGGVRGRLLLRLDGSTLIAANTGAPLDTAGVEGLSTLRASAKRDDAVAVGRFGVGFAAVLAVTDEPSIGSRSGAVRWSRAEAHTVASGVAGLAAEIDRRSGHVPVLRLPFPAELEVEPGYDTAVVLPLRDDDARVGVRRALSAVDDALLLVLPSLAEVIIEVDGEQRTLVADAPEPYLPEVGPASAGAGDGATGTLTRRRVGGRTWRIASRTGALTPALLVDRPVEERVRPVWSVSVAVPVDERGLPAALPPSMPAVVHAPTPTDDRTDLPVLVVASLPMDSTRRRVAPGPLTDHLVAEAGLAYAQLVASVGDPAALDLVPGPLGAGEVDGALHAAARTALAAMAFVPSASDELLRPDAVVLVDGLRHAADPAGFADVVAGLPSPQWWRPDPLRRLGARTVALADVVDELATLTLEPARWRTLYAALDGADQEELAALPVPLADGRTVRGPRGVLIPDEVSADVLTRFGLRVVAAEAAHPLLRRLGALEAAPGVVLRDPAVRARVAEAADHADHPGHPDDPDSGIDPAGLADAVLHLVAAAGVGVEDEPWLADLVLLDAGGEPSRAGELLLAGSPVIDVLDGDADEYTVAADLLSRHGADVLRAVGVRDGFAVVRDPDVALDDDLWHDLDDEDAWVVATRDGLAPSDLPPVAGEFVGVRDLDLVRDDAWPQALALLAADHDARAAVVEPARVLIGDGSRRPVVPYTAWWLRRHARVDGRGLDAVCGAGADPVVRALLHPVDLDVDPVFAAALGIVGDLAGADTGVLLDRLASAEVELSATELSLVYADIADRDVIDAVAPAQVRIPDGRDTRVVDAVDVVVIDGPHWLQLGLDSVIPGPAGLADLLDVDLADEVYDAEPDGGGRPADVPEVLRAVVPSAPADYVEHDDLVVAGRSVDWWVADGVVHAATSDGLARGVAWVAGDWDRRWVLAEALADPSALASLLADDAFVAPPTRAS